jgi:ubiquitin-protein ligase
MSSIAARINNEYKRLKKKPMEFVTFEMNENNIYEWKFVISGLNNSTYYKGGIYEGILTFPKEYPMKPPVVKFTNRLFHPNVYHDGKLCISILHEGTDETGYEDETERWSPILNVQTIFMSIISLLDDPNDESAANLDAAKLWRENKEAYIKKIKDDMKC